MTTVKDIARIIAARHGLTNAEAEIFMQMIVEVINDGLLQDRQVKIKGFGTFKLQTVKERTSVNVNTGEKVVIREHDKVSFTPDNVMKDIINKPFAHFETVAVDDDSPLLDEKTQLDLDADIEDVEEETFEAETIAVKGTPSSATVEEQREEEQAVTQESTTEDEPVVAEVTTEEEPVVAEEDSSEVETATEEEQQEDCEHPYPRCRNIFIYYGVLINIVVAAIAFALGYIASEQRWFGADVEEKPTVAANTPKETKPTKMEVPVAASVPVPAKATDTVNAEKEKVPEQVQKAEKAKVETPKAEETPIRNYDEDARVRTGAYYIVGTDKEVEVKEGQTLKSISRAYLGEGMECYVEVYNGKTEAKKGDKIKIPKLKLKKSLRKKQ